MVLSTRIYRYLMSLFFLFFAINIFAMERQITSFGTSWGELSFPSSTQREEHENLLLDGVIEQGISIPIIDTPLFIILFGKLGYTADTEELEYNNKLKLGAGVKLAYAYSNNGIVHAGIQYEYDNRFTSGRELHGAMFFLDIFQGWEIKPSKNARKENLTPIGYPGMTWAELRYPGSQDPSEKDDLIFEGAIEQGVDWFQKGPYVFNTFVEAEYIMDSAKLDWNNQLTLGGGIKLKMPLFESINAQIGVKYNHSRQWHSGNTEEDIIWFIGWYSAWEISKR